MLAGGGTFNVFADRTASSPILGGNRSITGWSSPCRYLRSPRSFNIVRETYAVVYASSNHGAGRGSQGVAPRLLDIRLSTVLSPVGRLSDPQASRKPDPFTSIDRIVTIVSHVEGVGFIDVCIFNARTIQALGPQFRASVVSPAIIDNAGLNSCTAPSRSVGKQWHHGTRCGDF